MPKPTYYEFFAGAGMARLGLGPGWRCLFANDCDPAKARAYRANWGGDELHVCDVARITPEQLPGRADLAWASFPCQDLSLAGSGAGLKGDRSGAFWPFWNLMKALRHESRAPSLIVLENVCGLLTSHGGADYAAIVETMVSAGYRVGAVVIDAALFVPQSRPRLFIIGARGDMAPGRGASAPSAPFHTPALVKAVARLPLLVRNDWLWVAPARAGAAIADHI